MEEVPEPVAGPGEVVVDVERAGVCGTDAEFFTGHMTYLHSGHASYPVRIGHEWCGRVRSVGPGVDDALVGVRVTGDTMLGCGTCRRCRRGAQHVCERRAELGIRGGRAGALAQRLAVPAWSLHRLPDVVDAVAGALVEPGGNAWRAARATGAGPGDRVLVMGAGTIGLLTALFARAAGAEVHLLDRGGATADDAAAAFGFAAPWTAETCPDDLPFDAIVDATTAPHLPGFAAGRVEPGGRLVCIGLASTPSTVDTRALVLGDVTVTGILSASPGLAATVEAYAAGVVDPRPIVAATVGLDAVGAVLAGERPAGAGPGPKVHVDPNR